MSDLVRSGAAPAPPAAEPAQRAASHPPHLDAPPARTWVGPSAGGTTPTPPPGPARPDGAPEAVDAASVLALTEAAEQLFAEITSFLERVPEFARRGSSFPWAELEALMARAQGAMVDRGELFWVANRPTIRPGVDYLAFHQARVGVLAMRVGPNAGYDRRRLVEVGMAGCLIDVGLWQLPTSMLKRLEGLSPDEQAQYRAHPRAGADLIRRWAPPYEGVAEMVLQHHEREQGQGFPQGLTGAAIRPEAKLLGLIDTYTGLTAPPSLRPGFRPHEAIREIVRSKRESFAPVLIKALLSEISVFPPGTLVRLNSGEMGCVVAVNRNHPLRPRVEVYDAKGRPLPTPKLIDLAETPFLYITGPVAEGSP